MTKKTAARTKERIPNKTQWALLDIISLSQDARTRANKAMDWAEHRQDAHTLLELVKLSRYVDSINRKALDALNGKYEGEVMDE